VDKNLEKYLKMTVFGWFLVVFRRFLALFQGSGIRDQGSAARDQGTGSCWTARIGWLFVFSVLENSGIELPNPGESKAIPAS
jgi:hypothetical protein